MPSIIAYLSLEEKSVNEFNIRLRKYGDGLNLGR
jgi:hypothetical protein